MQTIPAFTTIAWRLGHVIVGVLAARNAAHLGAPAASYETWHRVPVGAKEPYPRRPWPIWCCTSTAS